jgi:hypothetical protein
MDFFGEFYVLPERGIAKKTMFSFCWWMKKRKGTCKVKEISM